MPYKSEEARREAARLSMKKKREGLTTGVNIEGVNIQDEGQKLYPGAAPGAIILSDGQLWYPGHNGCHPKPCQCGAHVDRSTMDSEAYKTLIGAKVDWL